MPGLEDLDTAVERARAADRHAAAIDGRHSGTSAAVTTSPSTTSQATTAIAEVAG
jgi:hypothetical protein